MSLHYSYWRVKTIFIKDQKSLVMYFVLWEESHVVFLLSSEKANEKISSVVLFQLYLCNTTKGGFCIFIFNLGLYCNPSQACNMRQHFGKVVSPHQWKAAFVSLSENKDPFFQRLYHTFQFCQIKSVITNIVMKKHTMLEWKAWQVGSY